MAHELGAVVEPEVNHATIQLGVLFIGPSDLRLLVPLQVIRQPRVAKPRTPAASLLVSGAPSLVHENNHSSSQIAGKASAAQNRQQVRIALGVSRAPM